MRRVIVHVEFTCSDDSNSTLLRPKVICGSSTRVLTQD
jgi:hypothetical protein